ncbi:MAG: FecR domain-containing protein [Spirochaetes bacterium]|nr:FecR domain-containing protein [Spirochaetota bacterium]
MFLFKKGTAVLPVLIIVFYAFTGCKEKSNFAVAYNGIVNFVQGECFIIDGASEKPANPGDTVSQGMKISTRSDKALIDIYIDENVIRLSGKTELEFSKLFQSSDGTSEQVQLNLVKGSVFSKVVRKLAKHDEFSIKTPTAVASVRGTEFMVEQDEQKASISCLDGMVAVKDIQTDQEIIIAENEQVQAESGKDMVKSQIDSDELKAFEIIRNIKEIQADISKKYEDQKKEIMEKVDEQIEKDREMVEKQKETDVQNIENIKNETDKKAAEIGDAVDKNIDESTKKVDEQMKDVQPDLKDTAPDIDPNSF